MSNNFFEYLQKNGMEAFDKMADDLAKQLNEAKAKYLEAQKKKEEEAKAAAQKKENRDKVVESLARTLKFYYGEDMPLDPVEVADAVVKTIDDVVAAKRKIDKVKDKLEVVKDEDTDDGHVLVMKADLSDLSEEDLADLFNSSFFKL